MDLSGITKKEFDKAKEGLDSSTFLDAVKELVNSGKMTVEEGQAEIIDAVEKGKISVEEALPLYHEITGIDDETTEETIRRINEEIKNGLSNAD
jgi:polyhydroxyalkanoate synthesis regulator phasin